jgi:hypothetical protein
MSKAIGDAFQFGSNGTAANNFTLRTNNDGTLTLARGNVGATTQDLLTFDADGLPTFTQGRRVLLATAQLTTSGITKDFAVPAWVQEIDVLLGGVSLNNTALPLIQLGPVAGFETTGYKSTTFYIGGTVQAATNGYIVGVNGGSGGNTHQGIYSLKHMGGNQWVGSGNLCIADGNTGPVVAAGGKTLAGALTQLRFTSHDGSG